MNNNIQCSIESSTTKIELNSAVEGVFLVPELEGLAGLPEIRTTSGVNAGYDGGWTSAQNYDARLISIRGVIANPDVSKVEAKRRAIASLLGQGRKEQLTLRFTTEAGNAYAISVRTISCEMALQRVLTTQEFLIQLRADDPLIYDDGASSGTEAILQVQRALGGFEINFELPLAIGGGAEDTIVENGSETVYPIINLYGPLHSPTVVNRTTNQQMQILADLQYTISWSGYQTEDIGSYDQLENELDGAPLTLSQLLGNAEQTTYSGKNLLNINATPTLGHATTSISGQSITVTTDDQASTARATLPIEYEANREMTISFDATCLTYEPTATNTVIVYMRTTGQSDATTQISVNKTVGTTVHYTRTFTPDNNTKDFWFYLKSSAVAGVVSYRFDNVQVEYGATATEYEQFVGGTSAPNPSFPMPISTVTGAQTVTVTGKNLFGGELELGNINNTTGQDVSSTAYVRTANYITVAPSSQYTISENMPNVMYEYDASQSFIQALYPSSSLSKYTFTTTVTTKYVRFKKSVTDTSTKFMLELGSTATAYEPYQAQEFEVNLGKNLFDNTKVPFGTYGVSSTATDTGLTATITSAGTVKYATYLVGQRVSEGETYTLSANIAPSASNTGRIALGVCNADGSSRSTKVYLNSSGSVSYTITSADTATPYLYLYFYGNVNGTGNVDDYVEYTNLQLELGQTTAYAPYFTPIELAKIGTYQDRIYKDDGKWYIEKQVGKVVLDGSESWSLLNNGTSFRLVKEDAYANGAGGVVAPVLSDNFSPATYYNVYDGVSDYSIALAPNSGRIAIRNKDITTVADFKTWLASNPTTVYYALATPTTTEITDETLRAQLNFIASLYEGVNNISIVPTGGAQGEMVVKYATVKTINQDVAVIDSQARTITLNGQDIYHLKSEESEFLLLAPGDNKLYLTSEVSDDSGYAEVKFKQGYLSI